MVRTYQCQTCKSFNITDVHVTVCGRCSVRPVAFNQRLAVQKFSKPRPNPDDPCGVCDREFAAHDITPTNIVCVLEE